MKKIFTILLCVTSLFCCFFYASANADTGAVYTFGEVVTSAKPGDVVSVPVFVTVSQTPVNSVQCDVSFDESIFEFQKYKSSNDKGDHKLDLAVVGIKKLDPSKIGAIFVSSDGNSVCEFNNTRLVTLRFKVKENATFGSHSFKITYSKVSCNNVDMEKYSSEVYSPAECIVKISESPKGDVDGNGKITVNDAVVTLKYIAGVEMLQNTAFADIDGDGNVNVNDAIAILRYIARLSNEL